MRNNMVKIYIVFFVIISAINLIQKVMDNNMLMALGVILWALIIPFSFKRKEYKSLFFLWVLKMLFTCYIIYSAITMSDVTVNYTSLVISVIDLVLFMLAINEGKKINE